MIYRVAVVWLRLRSPLLSLFCRQTTEGSGTGFFFFGLPSFSRYFFFGLPSFTGFCAPLGRNRAIGGVAF